MFRVQTGDKGAASTAVQVLGDASGGAKKWTLLTGTYDAEKKQIALYVDDKAAGTAEVPAIWSGPGPVQLGRARHHGIWSGSFVGPLDSAVAVVFGGANCDGPMGAALHRAFPWVDVVVRGEAEIVLPDLMRDLCEGRPVRPQAGLCYREDGRSIAIDQQGGPPVPMDDVPLPLTAMLAHPCPAGESLEPLLRAIRGRATGGER